MPKIHPSRYTHTDFLSYPAKASVSPTYKNGEFFEDPTGAKLTVELHGDLAETLPGQRDVGRGGDLQTPQRDLTPGDVTLPRLQMGVPPVIHDDSPMGGDWNMFLLFFHILGMECHHPN